MESKITEDSHSYKKIISRLNQIKSKIQPNIFIFRNIDINVKKTYLKLMFGA